MRCNFFVQERRLDQPSEAALEIALKDEGGLKSHSSGQERVKGIVDAEVVEDVPVLKEKRVLEAQIAEAEIVSMEDKKTYDVHYSDVLEKETKPLSMHAIKCKCGDILSRKMKQCPSCGKSVELLLEELRTDFYRINFMQNSNKNK